MSENKIKHIVALGVWAALQAYFLLFHFSWANAGWFAMLLLFLLFTTVLGKKHDETQVVGTLGNLMGASFAAFLGYYVLSVIVPLFYIPEQAEFAETINIIGEQLAALIERTNYEVLLEETSVSVMLIAAAVVFLFSRSSKHPLLGILCKYFWSGTIFAFLIDALYHSKEILFMYVVWTLLFVACDIVSYRHNGVYSKAGKRWQNILNILLFYVLLVYPETLAPFAQKGYLAYYFLNCGLEWYHALYMLVVFAVAAYFMRRDSLIDQAKQNTDFFVCWLAVCVLITVFFMSRFYVGYWWIVAILYGIGITVSMTALHPAKIYGKADMKGIYLWFPAALSLIAIISVIAGHGGNLLITWAVIGGVILVGTQFLGRTNVDAWWEAARFYTVVLVAIGVVAAVALWGCNRLTFNFMVLFGMLVVSVAFMWVVSLDSGVFDNRGELIRLLVVGVFAVLCISLCTKNSTNIQIETDDNGTLTVEVSAHREDQTIECVEYYWLEDFLGVDESQEGFPEEILLDSLDDIDQDGRLRVVVTDNYGAETEQIYWVYDAPVVEDVE